MKKWICIRDRIGKLMKQAMSLIFAQRASSTPAYASSLLASLKLTLEIVWPA